MISSTLTALNGTILRDNILNYPTANQMPWDKFLKNTIYIVHNKDGIKATALTCSLAEVVAFILYKD